MTRCKDCDRSLETDIDGKPRCFGCGTVAASEVTLDPSVVERINERMGELDAWMNRDMKLEKAEEKGFVGVGGVFAALKATLDALITDDWIEKTTPAWAQASAPRCAVHGLEMVPNPARTRRWFCPEQGCHYGDVTCFRCGPMTGLPATLERSNGEKLCVGCLKASETYQGVVRLLDGHKPEDIGLIHKPK
jgi:hypothetical protein